MTAVATPSAAFWDRLLTGYSETVPACDSSWAVARISWQFAYKERRYWSSTRSIEAVEDIREIALRPWKAEVMPRRFCEAKVRVEGRPTLVRYSIISNTGFAGVSWGVEWCVVGYDYNLAYAPRCRMALP